MKLEDLIQLDARVKRRFVYRPDPKGKDRWTSYALEYLGDPKYQIVGDCDDLAQTMLHILRLHGVEKTNLHRALVKTHNAPAPDHLIGLVQLGAKIYSIGDTLGPPVEVKDNMVHGHEIVQVSAVRRKRWWDKKDPNIHHTTFARPKRVTNHINVNMRTDDDGIAFIKRHEEFRARAYDDLRPNHVLKPGDQILGTITIGYGNTGPEVKPGMVWTEAQATEELIKDIRTAENAVKRYVLVPLDQGQFNALVSFVFNVGERNFRKSTLLKRINNGESEFEIRREFMEMTRKVFGIKVGDPRKVLLAKRSNCEAINDEIRYQFSRWNKTRVNGRLKVLSGLVKRREDEADMFMHETEEAPPVCWASAA